MVDPQWAVPQLRMLLPLDAAELRDIIKYADSLPTSEATEHLQSILGDSPQASEFIASYAQRREPSSHGLPERKMAQDTLPLTQLVTNNLFQAVTPSSTIMRL